MSSSDSRGGARGPNGPNKKVLQAAATRAELVRVASDLLTERGFAGTALEEIARKVGVTKGALYHHFRDKRSLFDAVVAELLDGELRRIAIESRRMTADTHENSWERLVAITDLFLDGFRDPRLRRIVWIEAPAVLGLERWQEVVSAPILEQLRWIAGVFAERGVVEERFRQPLAQLLFGAVHGAGLAIAQAPDPDAKRAEMAPALHWMLQELFRRRRKR
jgi:AcrR family transcriptional regulator